MEIQGRERFLLGSCANQRDLICMVLANSLTLVPTYHILFNGKKYLFIIHQENALYILKFLFPQIKKKGQTEK